MPPPPAFKKHLERYGERRGPEFHITGVGINEPMPPCVVNRPLGTLSWLFMHFHDPVVLKSGKAIGWHPANSFMIWSALDGHYYGSEKAPWSHSWLHCVGGAVGKLVSEAGLPIGKPFLFSSRETVERLLSQIYAEATERKEPDETIQLLLLQILTRELGREAKGSGQSDSFVPERILAARRRIDTRLAEKTSLAELAKTAGLSVPHFCAEFKRHIGKPPIDYLIEARMVQARYLLRDMNLSIAEVSRMTGYDDPFQFSKLFKKRFGLSPRAARKALEGD